MVKLNIKMVDMENTVLDSAKKSIFEAFETLKEERLIANFIREEFDKQYGPSWNCIVGKNFGSHVVHQTKSYLFCSYGEEEMSVLLWKSG